LPEVDGNDDPTCLAGHSSMSSCVSLGQMVRRAFRNKGRELAVYAFDLLHLNGRDLTTCNPDRRRQLLERLLTRSKVPGYACRVRNLHLVDASDDGQKLLETAEKHKLEGIVSKRRNAPYRSGGCQDWVKVKTLAWCEANKERWRLFERG
jgi:ATP-dependent DNA ligase